MHQTRTAGLNNILLEKNLDHRHRRLFIEVARRHIADGMVATFHVNLLALEMFGGSVDTLVLERNATVLQALG